MKATIRYLLLSFLIGNFLGIGSHALAQKAVPLSEQEKSVVNQGSSTATAINSGTVKALPSKKTVKKKPSAATATNVAPTLSTGIKKTTAVPASPSYTPPTVKSVKQPSATTAKGVAPKPSTGIKKTTTFPVSPSYTPPASSAPQISGKPPVQSGAITITPSSGYVAPSFTSTPSAVGGTGISGQGKGVKSTGTYVAPTYTPPSLSLPSKTVGVGTAAQGQDQGIRTPSDSYVTPMYDPPRSGPLGSGTPTGQPGSATTTPRSVPLFPVSAGTGSSGQEQGAKATGSFLIPSSADGKGATPSSDASPSFSGSSAPPAVDNIQRMKILREKYGKTGTTSERVQPGGTGSRTDDGKGEAVGGAASMQTTGGGGTLSTGKTGKTATAVSLEAAAAASAASGTVEVGTKKESEGQGQSSDAGGTGTRPVKKTGTADASAIGEAEDPDRKGETAAEQEKDLRERFNIPDDVPIKSTAEALGFAKQVEALGGKLTPETWREQKEKGSNKVITEIQREIYDIPADADVGSWRDIMDIVEAAGTFGDGKVSAEMWRDVGRRGKDKVIDGMIEGTWGVSRPGSMSRGDLLKGLAEGERLGVPRQELPSFIQDWDRQRNGGITLDELLNKWMPGARAGIDRGGMPGDGLPGGPGSGSSGLPDVPTGPGGGSGGTGPGGAPGGGSGQMGNLVDVMRTGFGIGAAAGDGSGGTGIPGAPGSGSSGTGPGGSHGVRGGRVGGLLDPLNSGTGIGAPGQSGGSQEQGSGGGTPTTPGASTGSTGSSFGAGGTAPGSGGTGSQAGAGSPVTGPGGAQEWTRFTSDGQGGYYATTYVIDEDGNTVDVQTDHYSLQGNGTWKDDKSGDVLYQQPSTDGSYVYESTDDTSKNDTLKYVPDNSGNTGQGSGTSGSTSGQSSGSGSSTSSDGTGSTTGSSGSTTSSGSTGSGTDSSGSTASTGGTQGTEEGQSGMYNPDDDSLYRRRGMSAEERAKAMEEFQKLKPVDGGRGGEGGVHVTGRKMSDVDPAQSMRNRATPYTDPNLDADQSQHSGPIPVSDERGNIEQPVPEGDNIAPGFGSMGGATRPGGSQTGTGGGFDPRVAGEQPE